MNKLRRLPKIGGGAEGDIRITKFTGIFAEDPDATRKDGTGVWSRRPEFPAAGTPRRSPASRLCLGAPRAAPILWLP